MLQTSALEKQAQRLNFEVNEKVEFCYMYFSLKLINSGILSKPYIRQDNEHLTLSVYFRGFHFKPLVITVTTYRS